MIISYNGQNFYGWQKQKGQISVQESIENSCKVILGHPVTLVSASRTDRGVHAQGQVVSFLSSTSFNEQKWIRAFQALLPSSIGILSIRPVDDSFHPSYHSIAKIYRYRLWMSRSRFPYVTEYSWMLPYSFLDWKLIRESASTLIGEHDFTSFCSSGSGVKTKKRTLFQIQLITHLPLVDIWILGNGFLKQMVRNIVGTLVDIGRGAISLAISDILLAKDRRKAGVCAPSQGLTLVQVLYKNLVDLNTMIKLKQYTIGWPDTIISRGESCETEY